MITEAIVSMLAALMRGVADLFGTLAIPSWWTQVDGWLDALAGYASGFGQWLPIADAVKAFTFVMVAMGLAFVIRVVRVVLSLFTGGGGSAA